MTIKHHQVNEQYFVVYAGFDQDEVNELFSISISKFNIDNCEDDTAQLDENYLHWAVKAEIEEIITEEILSLEQPIIGNILFQYRGDIEIDSPVFVIAKFGVIPRNINFKLPTTVFKVPEFTFTDEMVNIVLKKILLANEYFDLVETTRCESEDDVVVLQLDFQDYSEDLLVDSEQGTTYVDFNSLFGYNSNEEVPLELFNTGDIKGAKVKEIYKKVPHKLTPELIKELDIFDLDNEQEFLENLKKILEQRQHMYMVEEKITNEILAANEILIKNEVIEHFLNLFSFSLEKEISEIYAEWDNSSEITIEENIAFFVKRQFLVHFAYIHQTSAHGFDYFDDIFEDYRLETAMFAMYEEDIEFDAFLKEHFDTIVLYDFYKGKGLIL